MYTKDQILIELEEVYDPEMGVNIVSLGLVYDIKIDREKVTVVMTLTSPMCPVGDLIKDSVVGTVLMLEGVSLVDVEFVWDPPWKPEMMSEEAKLEFGYEI